MRISSLLLTAVVLSVPAFGQDGVIRESTGERLQRLTKMELSPFDGANWNLLSSWTNGDALTSEATNGKVVVIMTWAGWNPVASRALPMAKRLHDNYEAEGLILVGVHHGTGWEEGLKAAERAGIKFLLAHDAENKFREALLVDQDPDFYVIDRAGQLRYADIVTESVETAVRVTLGETVDQAAGIRGRLAEDAQRREAEARRTEAIRSQIDLRTLPEVPFMPPSKAAYEATTWPTPPRDDQNRGQQQPQEPPILMLPNTGYHPAPPATAGRAVVVYFWNPNDRDSYSVMGEMDRLQRQMGRDLVVVGALVPIQDENRGWQQQQDTKNDPAVLTTRMTQFRNARQLDHALLLDLAGVSLASMPSRQGYGAAVRFPTPYAVLASSDGLVRFWGNPVSPAFRSALDRVIRDDPGIAARRRAEAEYIRTKGG
ncbi:MAG: TlpA family protein disulfide reductase [Phycisphaeraceae bacterium]|nr:TlpA family protein disulfide reductase [Phycisphaeraceae bacterium]